MAEKKPAAKKPPAAPPAKADPDGYQIIAEDWGLTKGRTDSQMIAALSTRSALTATTYKAFAGGGEALQVTDLMGELRKAGEEVAGGDMTRVEKMLVHQALTLDAIFNNMAQRSSRQDSFKGIEVLMRLALKAQAQARSTAEALALLKNPMPYIRQANITNGPQQVNNGAKPEQYAQAHASAGDFQTAPNKLLEADHERLDIGAPQAAGRADQKLEAVGAVNRA